MSKKSIEIKTEPPELSDEPTVGHHVMDEGYKLSHNEHLLNLTLQKLKESKGRFAKPTSSPAQEAAKARIRVCELHLRALYKKQAGSEPAEDDLEKVRKVQEELRKSEARLKRLTNEAQRQRRRRERLKLGLPPSSPSVLGVSKEIKFLPKEDPESSVIVPNSRDLLLMARADDRDIMGILRKCGNFKDLTRELRTQGFTLAQTEQLCGIDSVESPTSPEENQELEVEDNPAAVLEQSMSFEEDENNNNVTDQEMAIPQVNLLEIKSEEQVADDISGEDDNHHDPIAENNAEDIEFSVRNSQALTTEENNPSSFQSNSQPQQSVTDMVRIFAETYAMRHASQIREWQEQYQLWFQRQLESQQQWQEVFMREQIEQTRSMVENVTTTFLQEMQHILQNIITSVAHRPMVPFMPNIARNSECLFNVMPNSSQTT